MLGTICIPGVPPVDVGRLRRIIDSEPFQALRERRQLGLNHLVFPGAVHTRFEHCIGVLSLAQRLCRIHRLSGDEAQSIQIFALLHDIGHGPFSHQIEPVIGESHHENGLRILARLADEISACGAEPSFISAMLAEREPLCQWICDRNLGVDKLDYLSRDAMHIGFHGTPDIERIQYCTIMTSDGIAIEEKHVEDAKQLQRFYSYLHQHGYLNKTALSAQRMLQRACQERLAVGGEDRRLLWDFSDSQLLAFLSDGASNMATSLTKSLQSRRLHRSFLVIKPSGYAYVEREADKPIHVAEWPRLMMRNFCRKYDDLAGLSALEDKLADLCGTRRGEILFAAMPYFRKLIPKDLRVFSSGGHESYWLFSKDEDHKRVLESDYLRTFSIRLVCPVELRERLSAMSDAILSELSNVAQSE